MATKASKNILDEIDDIGALEILQCPLSNDIITKHCREEQCAWWMDGKCATVRIAQSLKIIAGKGVKE